MITGQLSCRGGREQLERDTADDNHDTGCGVDADPTDQETRFPPPARAIL